MRDSMDYIYILEIFDLCRKRIRQIIRYQEADLVDELDDEVFKQVPLITSYTITYHGVKVECKDLLIADTLNPINIYCLSVDNSVSTRINLSDIEIDDLKLIAKTIDNDIQKTEEWADNFFG